LHRHQYICCQPQFSWTRSIQRYATTLHHTLRDQVAQNSLSELIITTISTDLKYFTGELVHSQYYRCPDRFTGKRVLIIGAGESGSDITNEISKVASKCAIAVRGLHGHLIPRIQGILASC
jgi:hypothetical protein